MIILPTFEEEERKKRNESIRRTIRQHFEGSHQSIQVLDGEGDGLQYCSKHQGINIDDIAAPLDLGFLDQILLSSTCPLCIFIHRVCQTLLAVQLQKPGTWTRCSLLPIKFQKNYFFENGFRLGSVSQTEPFGRTINLQFDEGTYDFRRQFDDKSMVLFTNWPEMGSFQGLLKVGRSVAKLTWNSLDLGCTDVEQNMTSLVSGEVPTTRPPSGEISEF